MNCWYCEKGTMEAAPDLGSAWFRCGSCGATWTEVPKPAALDLVVEPRGIKGWTKYRPRHKRRVKSVK